MGSVSQAKSIAFLTNPFFYFAGIWSLALILYSFNWSHLCKPISFELGIFCFTIIALSLLLGFVLLRLRSGINQKSCENDYERTIGVTVALFLVSTIGMLYQRSIPLLNIYDGRAYNDIELGIPLIGAMATSYALFHGYRLNYLYFKTRRISYLVEYASILLVFILLLQRQNIVFSFAGLFIAWMSFRLKRRRSFWTKIIIVLSAGILVAFALFVFGAIGNVRYGIWDWNDSSMISAVGAMNSNYPEWLPKEYFWIYIYLVSPIVNLFNNIQYVTPDYSILYLLAQFIPSSISSRLGFVPNQEFLIQPSLTVGTAFVQPYLAMGYIGMYCYFFVIMLAVFFVLTCTSPKQSCAFAIREAMIYYLVLMIFDNPSTYLTTGYLLIIAIVYCVVSMIRRAKTTTNRI